MRQKGWIKKAAWRAVAASTLFFIGATEGGVNDLRSDAAACIKEFFEEHGSLPPGWSELNRIAKSRADKVQPGGLWCSVRAAGMAVNDAVTLGDAVTWAVFANKSRNDAVNSRNAIPKKVLELAFWLAVDTLKYLAEAMEKGDISGKEAVSATFRLAAITILVEKSLADTSGKVKDALGDFASPIHEAAEEVAKLYIENLDGIAKRWEEERGKARRGGLISEIPPERILLSLVMNYGILKGSTGGILTGDTIKRVGESITGVDAADLVKNKLFKEDKILQIELRQTTGKENKAAAAAEAFFEKIVFLDGRPAAGGINVNSKGRAATAVIRECAEILMPGIGVKGDFPSRLDEVLGKDPNEFFAELMRKTEERKKEKSNKNKLKKTASSLITALAGSEKGRKLGGLAVGVLTGAVSYKLIMSYFQSAISNGKLEKRSTVLRKYVESKAYQMLNAGVVSTLEDGKRAVRIALSGRALSLIVGTMSLVPAEVFGAAYYYTVRHLAKKRGLL